MLTFVVYYRIHLNLNLEASARQWPNNKPHQFEVGGGGSHPETIRTYGISVILGSQAFSEYEQKFPKSWNIRLFRLCSICNESDRLWRLIECSWAFLSKKRLTHSGANGFFEKAKNQTVCPYLWEILDTVTVNTKLGLRPVHKVTLTNNAIYSFFGSMYQRSVHVHKSGLNSSRWRKWHKFASTTVFLGWTSPPVQTIAISRHAHRQIYTYNCNIYVYRWIYILAIHAHLNWIILDWRPQLYTE